MMLARFGWGIYVTAVLFAALVLMLCAFGSLVGVLYGGRPDWSIVTFFAFLALAVALAGRAIRYELGGG